MKKARVDVDIVREVAAELAVNCAAPEEPAATAVREPEPVRVTTLPTPRPVERTSSISRLAGPVAALAAVVVVAALFWFNHARSQRASVEAGPPVVTLPTAAPAPSQPPAAAPEASAPTPAPPPTTWSPTNETATAPAATNAADMTVVVKPMDTLWQISQRYLGRTEPQTFKAISQMNPELKDLDHIEVGQHIRLPRSPNASNAQAGAQQNQESQSGSGRERP